MYDILLYPIIIRRGDFIKKFFIFIWFLMIVGVFTASDNQVKVVEKNVPTATEVTTAVEESEAKMEEDKEEQLDEQAEEIILITADVSKMAKNLKSNINRVVEKDEKESKSTDDSVVASFYGEYFHGRETASGEKYDMNAFTAAHKTLPLGSVVKITNIDNNKSVVVRINDRGPYIEGREIDLSKGSFAKIGNLNKGLLNVEIEVLELGNKKVAKK